jgi:hypothetical protein
VGIGLQPSKVKHTLERIELARNTLHTEVKEIVERARTVSSVCQEIVCNRGDLQQESAAIMTWQWLPLQANQPGYEPSKVTILRCYTYPRRAPDLLLWEDVRVCTPEAP